MNSYEKLLLDWCDGMLPLQIKGFGEPHDGGFLCHACTVIHGRADNAMLPMMYAYKLTGDEKYLDSAKAVFKFQKRLICADGGVYNDGNNGWKGITVFSFLCQIKSVIHFGDIMGDEFKNEVIDRCRVFAEYCHKTFGLSFHSNINYYAAASDVLITAGKFFGNEEYTAHGKELLAYCLDNFTENGMLLGEGFPHKDKSERGCMPVDIGYNVEESIPCLVEAATVLNDLKALKILAEMMKKTLDFMLPDGGWNNTFGTRNNKWTYYGSRTSDGCLSALVTLGKTDPVFYEAAKRNAELQRSLTSGGLLYGGYSYKAAGQQPCVHHTFCHAAGLAEALLAGLSDDLPCSKLPIESEREKIKYYKETDTYLISVGDLRATVTGYDYKPYTYTNGASHASGGTLTCLYGLKNGAAIMGSTYDYHATEPLNMQWPIGNIPHRTLLPRAEVTVNGKKYASCLYMKPEIVANENENGVTVTVKGGFGTVGGGVLQNAEIKTEYVFFENKAEITVAVTGAENPTYILPVIKSGASVETDCEYKKETVFWLSGGFTADEYTLKPRDNVFSATIMLI